MMARGSLLGVLVMVAACRNDDPRRSPDPSATAGGKVRIEIVAAPATGDIPPYVVNELARAKQEGRDLLVYVGAKWCEPCKRFHAAAEKGELDATFPKLRMIEFDYDRDKDRLATSGYLSRMIPLFQVPKPDGTGSESKIEGSVSGEGAVAQITPRLKELVEKTR